MTADDIRDRIRRRIADVEVTVRDTTGTSDHFEAIVVSPVFEGKSMVEQHRLVYEALGSAVGGEIHALALRTFTRDQWARANASA